MSQEADLDRLIDGLGIEGSYRDAHGEARHMSAETKRALLSAMGVASGDERALGSALRDLEGAMWRRPLQPVVVTIGPDAAPSVPIVVAADRSDTPLSWLIEEETGRLHRGRLTPADLPCETAHVLDGHRLERRIFTAPVTLPTGYHRFRLDEVAGNAGTSLIVAPPHCYRPPALEGDGRAWGIAIQLYALRSERNWGIGDFTDLADLVEGLAPLGVGAIGVNPLHALFLENPEHASPYSPASRRFLNVLYIDVEAVPDLADCVPAQERIAALRDDGTLQRLRAAALVDYAGVSAIKLPLLEELYRSFRTKHLASADSVRAAAFREFQERSGEALESFSLFEALSEHVRHGGAAGHGWKSWPAPYQDRASASVAAFAAANRERIEFFQYLQWLADLQLGAVAKRCAQCGMPIGLYRDLALGIDSGGAESWADPSLFAERASVGAPPDIFNTKGQNWGLPPLRPTALRENGYRLLADVLRANMCHTGALRIDHILGLMRMFWVPEGATPAEGGYVRYPLEDMLGILALESQRNRCLVIGEDLGTVPEGFVDRLRRFGILSYRLLYFEQDGAGNFLSPDAYPPLALVAVTTHDLPTLPGYWRGRDIDVRTDLDLFASDDKRKQAVDQRERDRHRLLDALRRQGLLPPEADPTDGTVPALSPALVEAIYRYLAQTPAKLLMVQIEDVLGEVEQVNLPGTTDQHPNWRRKLPLDIDGLVADPQMRSLAAMLTTMRPVEPASGGAAR